MARHCGVAGLISVPGPWLPWGLDRLLGRPAQSVDYDIIVAGGKKVWTDGDPTKQPHLMAVLATNIRNTKHPKLVERKETRDHSRRAHRE